MLDFNTKFTKILPHVDTTNARTILNENNNILVMTCSNELMRMRNNTLEIGFEIVGVYEKIL